MYDYEDAMVGGLRLCWYCRRELAMRTVEKPLCVPVDCGRLGYKCKKCGGSFTNIDAGTCKCPARAKACAETAAVVEQWSKWAALCLWKPKQKRNRCVPPAIAEGASA